MVKDQEGTNRTPVNDNQDVTFLRQQCGLMIENIMKIMEEINEIKKVAERLELNQTQHNLVNCIHAFASCAGTIISEQKEKEIILDEKCRIQEKILKKA